VKTTLCKGSFLIIVLNKDAGQTEINDFYTIS